MAEQLAAQGITAVVLARLSLSLPVVPSASTAQTFVSTSPLLSTFLSPNPPLSSTTSPSTTIESIPIQTRYPGATSCSPAAALGGVQVLEGPFFGARKPHNQAGSKLRTAANLLILGRATIEEGDADYGTGTAYFGSSLIMWLPRHQLRCHLRPIPHYQNVGQYWLS